MHISMDMDFVADEKNHTKSKEAEAIIRYLAEGKNYWKNIDASIIAEGVARRGFDVTKQQVIGILVQIADKSSNVILYNTRCPLALG